MDGHRRVFLASALFIVASCAPTGLASLTPVPVHADEVTAGTSSPSSPSTSAARAPWSSHFRDSTMAGILQGEQIGRQAVAQCVQPFRP
jgi:hypothetical protein